MTEAPSADLKAAGDSERKRRLLFAAGEVALLVWILGVFWYYYESQGFAELFLHFLGRTE